MGLITRLSALSIAALSLACASAGPVFVPGNEVTQPVVLTSVQPDYTPAARRARVQGRVVLDCIVKPDGSVGDVAVAQSLDFYYGLDSQAVQAVKQWTFRPGTRGGKPVAVRVPVELTFVLP